MMMPHITQKYKDNLDAARNANHSLAVFIKVRIHTHSSGERCVLKCKVIFMVCMNNDKVVSLFHPVALFQPDGQRLHVQADQQLHQLLYAWRPEGMLTIQTETAIIKAVGWLVCRRK